MSFTLKLELKDAGIIIDELGLSTKGKVQKFFTQESYRRMSKYVPFRTGKLRDTVTIEADSITYLVPYARRQYYENRGNGIRGKYWDEKMASVELRELISDVEKYVRGRA